MFSSLPRGGKISRPRGGEQTAKNPLYKELTDGNWKNDDRADLHRMQK